MDLSMHQSIRIGALSTSRTELVDLAKAWAAISVAFALVMNGLSFDARFLLAILLAGITVGLGFLLHEFAHKVVAQRYGCFAEFRAFDAMLLLAIVAAFFRFVFAAPGAVMISGQVTRRENGLISVVGPWTNIGLALLFLALGAILPELGFAWGYGFRINTWLAVFNMIPVWVLDGKKVWDWNKAVWSGTVAVAVALMWVV